METIKQYYLLNTAKLGHKRHIVDTFSDPELTALISKKETTTFFRRVNQALIARDSVVGGAQERVVVI